jgi:DNA repair protein RadC
MTPEDVWQSMIDVRASKREHLVVFYLDSRNAEIQRHVVSIGTLNEASAHPREVFEEAVKHSAAGIILAHNHPSGDLEPSRADIELTRKLWNAGKLLDIELVDHVIVTKDGYRSILQDIHG